MVKPLRSIILPLPTYKTALAVLSVVLIALSIIYALIQIVMPAFGYIPVLGGESLSLWVWEELLFHPATLPALRLSIFTGVVATIISLALSLLLLGFYSMGRGRKPRFLTGLLAVPHAGLAVGILFLLAPSGWIIRLISPGLTGWEIPPNFALVQDGWGMGLILGLLVKETPFLFFVGLAALNDMPLRTHYMIMTGLGYGPIMSFFKTVVPVILPRLALPIFVVLVYNLSQIDMALILGPVLPPTFSVLIMNWVYHGDLQYQFLGAAGALLLLVAIICVAGLFFLSLNLLKSVYYAWVIAGTRHLTGSCLLYQLARLRFLPGWIGGAALLVLLLWSLTERWQFPANWPQIWQIDKWQESFQLLNEPLYYTVSCALASVSVSLAVAILWLEQSQYFRFRWLRRLGEGALLLPLLLPQILIAYGMTILLAKWNMVATWPAFIFSHVLFVLPYVFLVLSGGWRRFHKHHTLVAAGIGITPRRFFWQVKMPILLPVLLSAFAIGFAVSVAQYIPTLFLGGGRFPTLTLETMARITGSDRRVLALTALWQMGLPLFVFGVILGVNTAIGRYRRGLATHIG